MENTLLGAGIACIIAAIVGGGLSAFGIQIPVLNSVRRQILLAFFGIVLVVVSQIYPRSGNEGENERKVAKEVFHSDEDKPRGKLDETPVGPIFVVTTADPKHPDGRYFYFDAAALDQLLGRIDWDKRVYQVSKQSDKGFRRTVFFRSSAVSGATAHGRFLPKGEPNAWHEGEPFYIIPKDRGPWNEKEQ